jgi:hypothetical protein
MNSVFIEAKEWVDKTYGNSYFSARIYVDGEEVGRLPFQYGYETMYEQKALEELNRLGLVSARRLWELKQAGIATYSAKIPANKQQVKMFGNSQI